MENKNKPINEEIVRRRAMNELIIPEVFAAIKVEIFQGIGRR